VVEIPASDHIIQYAYGWPLERAIDAAVKATSVAKELGLYTAFFTIDATRADIKWLLDLLEKVATEGHMDSLVLVDTMGGAHPDAIRYFVRKVRERFSQPLEAHFHNDFGLAVANTLAALTMGVDVAHVTIGGMSERAGAAALEEVVLALLTLYGIDVGMKCDRLYDLAGLATSLTGHTLAPNKAIVGKDLFAVESGIVAAWTRRCQGPLVTEVFPMHWELMGQPGPKVVLGKGSGTPSIAMWLEARGREATTEQIEELTLLVKERSLETRGLLTEQEFDDLAARVLGK
jgi:isopropylmalate/homocitrate/citramalate synthase